MYARTLRTGLGLAVVAVAATSLVAVAPAQASSAGTLTVTPATGSASSISTFETSARCPDGDVAVVKVFGGDLDPAGASIPTPAGFLSPKNLNGSVDAASYLTNPAGGMTIPASQTWASFASSGTPSLSRLSGVYTVRAWCSSGDWFDGQLTFSGTDLSSSTTYFAGVATAPTAPTGVTAVAGNASAAVQWTAPSSNGGSAITGYTVTAAPGGATCTTSGATSCTVTGLANGTAYTFRVVASNSVGAGAASAASAAVTPVAPVFAPGAPTTVVAKSGLDTKSTVAWLAPASNGGSAITGYTVTSSNTSGKPVRTCTTAGLTCTVTGLSNGIAYTFRVTATNAVGTSAASAASAAVKPLGSMLRNATKIITIKGTAKVGYKVTRYIPLYTFYSSSGSKFAGITYAYQWLRNGKPISKAVGSVYKLTSLDKGKKITVKVTAKKFGFRAKVGVSKYIVVK